MMDGGYKVGFHVSISGGISNSVDNAKGIGCSAFQIFSRNPRGWAAKPLTADDISLFRGKLSASGIDLKATVVHMPYLPNLSGPAGESYIKSVDTLAGEVGRTGDLGIPYLVIHLGSHMGKGAKSGIDQLANAVNTARDRMKNNKVTILLENSAGQKNSVGSQFEEMGTILDKVGDAQVCLDTCHLFAAGHDLRTQESVAKVLDSFDKEVGLDKLKVVHLNDSKGPLGSNLDRHEHIGLGNIGAAGLAAFVRHKAIAGLPIIMETPIEDKIGEAENMKAFRRLTSDL
jgi:deoxyribonuclease-4